MSPDVHAAAVLSAITATRIENRLTARCMRLLVYWFRRAVSSDIYIWATQSPEPRAETLATLKFSRSPAGCPVSFR